MIGSDLEGADLESGVTSWAASATSDDAAAVRAVIEAYGDRLAAADVAGVVSRFDDITVRGDLAAVRATSQGRSRSALPARRNQRVSGSCSFWNARGPLEDHAVHVPADAGAVRRGLLRHLASPPPGFGHVPHPLAAAGHDAAPATPTSVYLPVQGPCR